MSTLTKIILFTILYGLCYVLYLWAQSSVEEINRMLGGLGAGLLAAGITAAIGILYVLPWLSARATDVAYDSGARVDDDPRWKAVVLRNNGQFDEAIEVFRKIDEAEPEDRFALTEIFHINLNKKEDPDAAWQTLEEGAARVWPNPDDTGYFYVELAKLAAETYQDQDAEIGILERTIAALPETRFSANAMNRLRHLREGDIAATATASRPQVGRPVVPPRGPQEPDSQA